jgi:hypothetical protein
MRPIWALSWPNPMAIKQKQRSVINQFFINNGLEGAERILIYWSPRKARESKNRVTLHTIVCRVGKYDLLPKNNGESRILLISMLQYN